VLSHFTTNLTFIFAPVLKIKEKNVVLTLFFFNTGAQLCYSEETSGGSERVGGRSGFLTTQAEQTSIQGQFLLRRQIGKGTSRYGASIFFICRQVECYPFSVITGTVTIRQCSGTVSRPPGSGFVIICTDPDPSIKQAKSFCCFFITFHLKGSCKCSYSNNKQEKRTKKSCWHLEASEENNMIRIRNPVVRIRGSGFVSKHHGSGTLSPRLKLCINFVCVYRSVYGLVYQTVTDPEQCH
jgi:hypothetical protein